MKYGYFRIETGDGLQSTVKIITELGDLVATTTLKHADLLSHAPEMLELLWEYRAMHDIQKISELGPCSCRLCDRSMRIISTVLKTNLKRKPR